MVKDISQLPIGLIEDTYTVEFYHEPNNLTICVDLVSSDSDQAVRFARRRFNIPSTWKLVGVDKKYGQST